MDDVEREPCPRCGEPTAIAGRLCPYCQGSLLVDLVTAQMGDPRSRYTAARDLSLLAPAFRPIHRVQEALAASESVLVRGLTREAARAAILILERNGGRGRAVAAEVRASTDIEPEYVKAFETAGAREWLVFLVPVLLTSGLLFFLLRGRPPSPTMGPQPTPRVTLDSGNGPSKPSLPELAARALDSTASVLCASSGGAGFFVTPDLLVTNDHVLCPKGSPVEVVLHDGRKLPGQVEARDDWIDIALVRVPGAAVRPLPLGDATAVAPGETVLIIGNPFGLDFTVTQAIISHDQRNLFGIAYLQFDGNVNPGNSGGPLLDSEGRAVGVVSMMMVNARGLGLALPVNYLYEMPSTKMPLPVPAPDFARWRVLQERVKQQDKLEADTAWAALRKPGLSSAAMDPRGEVYAVIVECGMPAGATPFTFELLLNELVVCHPTAIVESWDLYAHQREHPMRDARYVRWLEKIGLGSDIYVGTATVRMEGCPDRASVLGAQLLLREADPGLNRAVIRMIREMP
jgi:serine protease Do